MAKSANQKLKLLYLQKYLLEHSDENHPVTVADMIAYLAGHDISAERKSIYDDLEALRQFGLDIIKTSGRSTGYFVGERDFELPELKLLVDSVQSSKFITHKKTLSLIKKIESLASVHDAQLLQRQVYVRNRVKSMNESVYYNVDEISGAITQDRNIKFLYFEYTTSKEHRYRRDGDFYEISPFALMWDDENYYMLGWEEDSRQMKHFRVDKMTNISTLETRRTGKEHFEGIDMSAYTQKVFGMFSGEPRQVKLRFEEHLVSAVIDRFGKDLIIMPEPDGSFTVNLDVVVSPLFFGWVFGFATEVQILHPADVREEMRTLALAVAEQNGG
ncbi:MAG: WYL domain-containing protein [Ruminococcaceae bacterium]|nr:WYL domain-containing protein [Oscillospiraceae bacterium]